MEVGTVLSLPGCALAELAGLALDFAWIDLEHGALGLGDVQAMVVGLTAAGCAAHVRVSGVGSEQLPAILDAGVDGVVVPRVESGDEAATLVSRLRYPPAGRRGVGRRRAGSYGRQRTEKELFCCIQIESRAGVDAASEIAAVDGVNAVVVGCSDLSVALDVPDDLGAEAVRAAIAEVAHAAAAAGVAFGLAGSGDPATLARLAAGRADLLVYSTDTRIYSAAIDAAVASVGELDA